ncbi:serine/threonine-protein kinase PpkA [Phycisphaerales bacterium]|nr:serine/threonine-protein kinase PpkA [Phycisphaerales bacterium]
MSERKTDRVREILDLALTRPSGERAAFVAGAAGEDEYVRAEVLSLLGALERAGDSLEPPAAENGDVVESLTGLTLGPYVVGERIGAGGMGVVYAARDTRLGRSAAVKALPANLARDPHRRARLEHEARLLAALSHPNIAVIYGVEDTPRGPVIILELVPGRTLAEELAVRRMALEDAVAVARQIARGLEAAHAAGIVHRDLKPANIKITPDGVVKILDLGVAKSTAMAGEGAPAVATQPGVIVGTTAYMSPEQARGRPVDKRSDLWALGCVLYEMLTGARAFDGETASDAAAAVLRAEPDWARLPAKTPAGVRRMLRRCLQKDAALRLRDAGDALLDLDSQDVEPAREAGGWRGWAAAGAAVLAVVASLAGWFARGPAPEPVPQLELTIESPEQIPAPVTGGSLAFSPDGTTLAYVAGGLPDGPRLYLRRLDGFRSEPVEGVEHARAPFFSPRGDWIGYWEVHWGLNSALKRVPIGGGPVQTIMEVPYWVYGATWGDDNTIVCSTGTYGTLWRIAAEGGAPEVLFPEVSDRSCGHPEMLPGSKVVLFTGWWWEGRELQSNIDAFTFETGKRHTVVADATQPRLSKGRDQLVFYRRGALMSAPFDTKRVRLTGEPRHIIGIADAADRQTCRYAVSSNGTIAFLPGNVTVLEPDLAWFGIDGRSGTLLRGSSGYHSMRLSPDGTRIAYTTVGPEFGLWVHDLERQTTLRLTNSVTTFPVWTRDGKRVAYQQIDGKEFRIFWTAADGSGGPELLYEHPGLINAFPTDFTLDGSELLCSVETGPRDVTDLYIVPVKGERKARLMMQPGEDRVGARLSPDGTMIAYTAVEAGVPKIYIQRYPSLDRKVPVTIAGGERPVWSGDGKRLFFRMIDIVYAVDVEAGPEISASKPVEVLAGLPGLRFDVSADGTKFYMARPRGDWGARKSIHVVAGALE